LVSDAPPHHRPRARNVIFLYMNGAPSHVDTFDPKPRLDAEDGKPIGIEVPKTQFDDVGAVLRSPWRFARHGECGAPVSELFPHVARHVDDICFVKSMTSKFSEHTGGNYFLHTGHGIQGRPSMGAWIGYGLGSEAEDLPGFVVLNGGLIPVGGLENFSSGFLPANHQGSVFDHRAGGVAHVERTEPDAAAQRRKLDLLARLDGGALARGPAPAVEAAIENHELAFRMQAAVPDLMDLSGESAEVRSMYGLDHPYEPTRTYGTQCLLARRMVERGVRFVELTCPHTGHDRWDQHGNLKQGHEDNARAVDQPIAALLTDLKGLGLLDETLVLFAGEFGRTPVAQGKNGRDHNPFGFTVWLAGGGARGGATVGATDEYGYHAVEDVVEMYDLHATILHLLGIDHERLTYRYSSREMRLTDVHGHVVPGILA
ncbi:MAG: DUF1501 domain-containing protein, partial [Planctomycetota bacterium JB042]